MYAEEPISPPQGISQRSKRALRNPWVLGWLAMVAVVFIVNAGMVATAMGTFPGLVTKEYYKRGENYHQVIEKRRRLDELGWAVTLHVPDAVVQNRPTEFHLIAVDGAGVPLQAEEATLYAYRSSDVSADFQVPMERLGAGRFRAAVAFPLKGEWDLVAAAKREGIEVDFARKVMVKSF